VGDIEDFERSTRRKRRMRFAILGLVIASPFLWVGWHIHERTVEDEKWREEERQRNALTDTEKAELDKLVPDLRRRLQAAGKAFAEDVTPAKLAAVVPGEDPCPVQVPELAAEHDAYSGGVTIMKPGEAPKPVGIQGAAQTLEGIAQEIQRADEPTKSHLSRIRDVADGLGIEVFLVGERTEPLVLADSYVPGRVRGTAIVYSADARRVVCAADIDVENASEVNIEYTTSSYDVTGSSSKREAATAELARDLGTRTRKAIRAGLRAVR
jgi:hypothetical protein